MSDIVPTLTPKQFDLYQEYMDQAARPIFCMIADIKLIAGRRYTLAPDGKLADETFLFTPEQQKQLDELRDLLQTVRETAMNYALNDGLPPRR